jgi:hypothetical protein
LPLWLVWCPGYGEGIDDARETRATDARSAAERWAERSDRESGGHSIVGGDDVLACVLLAERKGQGDAVLYRVSGESVTQYDAVFVGREEEPCL